MIHLRRVLIIHARDSVTRLDLAEDWALWAHEFDDGTSSFRVCRKEEAELAWRHRDRNMVSRFLRIRSGGQRVSADALHALHLSGTHQLFPTMCQIRQARGPPGPCLRPQRKHAGTLVTRRQVARSFDYPR